MGMHHADGQEAARRPLSPGQARCLGAIKEFISGHGYSPALTDIAESLGLESTNSVRDYLVVLEAKGYVRRAAGVARSITVIEDVAAA